MGSEVQVLPGPWIAVQAGLDGGVAQLVERLLCKQEVVGSIPSASIVLGGCDKVRFTPNMGDGGACFGIRDWF